MRVDQTNEHRTLLLTRSMQMILLWCTIQISAWKKETVHKTGDRGRAYINGLDTSRIHSVCKPDLFEMADTVTRTLSIVSDMRWLFGS
jgi:hypothetical protein